MECAAGGPTDGAKEEATGEAAVVRVVERAKEEEEEVRRRKEERPEIGGAKAKEGVIKFETDEMEDFTVL